MAAAVRRSFIPLWLGAITLGMALLAFGRAESSQSQTDFGEINVERINIVEPGGKYRLVIANSERFPGLFMDGKEYKHHSRRGGGMLFFNDEGDEVGGLGFGSASADGQYVANAHMMFDQYKQDQTLGLLYQDQNGERVAGMRVWDRPDYSIKPLMEYSDRAARAGTDAEREAIRKEMMDYALARGGAGAERFFAGKELKATVVRLADAEGRPRLLIKVGEDGEASVEFLDAEGKVTKRIAG